MIHDRANAQDSLITPSMIISPSQFIEECEAHGHYAMRCFDARGNLKWEDEFHNVVTTEGKNRVLEIVFGSQAKDTWYFDLITASSTGPVVGDTLATHGGWTAATPGTTYTSANRLTGTWGAASAGSKALSSAVSFTINTTVTIYGAFLCNASTGTTGQLWSAGTFTSRACVATDVLNVSYSTGL